MDRSAVFVDAGYLLAESGKLCCGTGNRQLIRCAYWQLISYIGERCRQTADAPILRTYWYDAAQGGIPTSEQLEIAGLPSVKLRLGRLAGGRQKGVDSLIFRDLMVLASTRSIATAYLLAGDEDLREAVVYAQDVGVRVVLVGVDAASGSNQADALVREADDAWRLRRSELEGFLERVAEAPPPIARTHLAEVARGAAEGFAAAWASRATADEVRDLLGLAPIIPAPLDRELLFSVQEHTGSLVGQDAVRRSIRTVFLGAIRRAGAAHSDEPPQQRGDA